MLRMLSEFLTEDRFKKGLQVRPCLCCDLILPKFFAIGHLAQATPSLEVAGQKVGEVEAGSVCLVCPPSPSTILDKKAKGGCNSTVKLNLSGLGLLQLHL